MKDFVRTALYVVGGILAVLIVLSLLRGLVRLLMVAVLLAIPVMIGWAVWHYVLKPAKKEGQPELIDPEEPPAPRAGHPRAQRTLDRIDKQMDELNRRLSDTN